MGVTTTPLSAIRARPPANGRPESTGLHRFRRIAVLLSFKSSCNEGLDIDVSGPSVLATSSFNALLLASSSIQAFATKVLSKGLQKSLAGTLASYIAKPARRLHI